MFITEQEMRRRLESSKNLSNILKPEVLQTVAKSLILQKAGDENSICATLEVSKREIHSLCSENEQKAVTSIERIRDMALDRMMIAMGLMTEEKFENASLKELSNATANLSRVIEHTSTKETSNLSVQFIMHRPEPKKITDYEVVDV